MGREIKRVPLDFAWTIGKVWKGYLNPWRSKSCDYCDGSGYNPETKRIADDWYDFSGTGKRWDHKITQDEVDALIAKRRLWDFTRTWTEGRWVTIEPPPVVTAEMVNAWSLRGLGHDAINQGICVEARAKRLGVWGYCKVCRASGERWPNLYVRFRNWLWRATETPRGQGWQVWETVSEGSPVTPVFSTREALVDYLVEKGYSRKSAESFVHDGGWVPSMIAVNGKYYNDIESSGI